MKSFKAPPQSSTLKDRFLIVGLFLQIVVSLAAVWSCSEPCLREGDLLFQTPTGSSLSKAIEEVTQIDSLQGYVHVGMLIRDKCCKNSRFKVVEAAEKGVCLSSLDSFCSNHTTHVYRLKKEYQHLVSKAKNYALTQLGKPYDSAYLPDIDKFYCSELILEAFRYANSHKPFFETSAMTFKSEGTFLPEWIAWYQHLGIPIPESVQGSNPTGLSRDKRLTKIKIILP